VPTIPPILPKEMPKPGFDALPDPDGDVSVVSMNGLKKKFCADALRGAARINKTAAAHKDFIGISTEIERVCSWPSQTQGVAIGPRTMRNRTKPVPALTPVVEILNSVSFWWRGRHLGQSLWYGL